MINDINIRNRNILKDMIEEGHDDAQVSNRSLTTKGFQFDYLTHVQKVRNVGALIACYDYGYMHIGGDLVLIMKLPPLPTSETSS